MIKPILTYYDVADGVKAFSSTRHGGVSVGNYGEFNINEYCGDSVEAIATNREALCAELEINSSSLVMPHQTHGVEIRQIGEEFMALPKPICKMILDGVDGVMTSLQNVCIGVSTADCIPVLLYDSEHHAVCAVHAGWRGTVKRVVVKAIAEMRAAYGTNPNALKACIGPGISLDNFEVGQEVYQQFEEAGFDMSTISKMYDKWHIDLWECNRLQMLSAGVNADNILVSGICTYNNIEDYFSARRLGVDSGRVFTGIILK